MNSLHETTFPLHPCCDQCHQKHALMEVSNRILNRIKQSKQHSGLCLQQVTAAERFIPSQEKEQWHSGFDQGPLVWHYQLPRAVSRAPGYTTCSQSVQRNSFTHDQGGEYDLLTPSGEKGKVYAHKNDIAEQRAAGARQSSAVWALHSEAALQGQHSTDHLSHTAPPAREPFSGSGTGNPHFPAWYCAQGWGNTHLGLLGVSTGTPHTERQLLH